MAERVIIILLLAIVVAASWQPTTTLAAPHPAPLPQVAPCATAVAAAIAQRGKPYVWGDKGPSSFDCSGLTSYAWSQAGFSIGLSTWDQMNSGVSITCNLADLAGTSTSCWEPGDLIFLRDGGSQHVAMYIGNGLFADAYNPSTGVIIHKVEGDSYYQAHFWQARRITSCSGVSVTLPSGTDTPSSLVGLEEIPDLLPSVSYQVSQCGTCDPNGAIFLPPTVWGDSWPSGWETMNLPVVFQKVISWLAWQIREVIRQLICWLFSMLQMLLNALSMLANTILISLNALWKMLVLLWMTLRAYFYALWEVAEWFRTLFSGMMEILAGIGIFISFIWEMIVFVGQIIGDLLAILWTLASIILGLIGWIGGLMLGFWGAIISSLSGTTVPVQLGGDPHPIYYMVRGGLEAILDSAIGWLYWLVIAAIYIGFIYWASRFLSKGTD